MEEAVMWPADEWIEYEAHGDDYVPIEQWGKDHWSTFAYLETRAVDANGVIRNAQMRCHPRLHREFANVRFGPAGDASAYPTRLKDGELSSHDDWSCLEDMVAAGLLRAWFRRVRFLDAFNNAEARIELTDAGKEIAAQLRQHKMDGGQFHTFEPVISLAT